MSDVDNDIKELLREKADEMRLGPAIPAPVLRRARRRRGMNGVLTGALAAGVVVGAFVGVRAGIDAFGSGRPVTPGGIPTPSSTEATFPAIWPETNPADLAATQQQVDEGHMPLRADAEGTAVEFATNVMRWDYAQVMSRVLSNTDGQAVVEVWNPESPITGSDRNVIVGLAQLGRTGEGGVWSVNEAWTSAIQLKCPARWAPGPITVCGTVAYAPPSGLVSVSVYQGNRFQLDQPEGSLIGGAFSLEGQTFKGGLPQDLPEDASAVLVELLDKDGKVLSAIAFGLPQENLTGTTVTAELSDVWHAPSVEAATDPETTALAFAKAVLGWPSTRVHLSVTKQGEGVVSYDLWSLDMTSTFTPGLATTVTMQSSPTKVGTAIWAVTQVQSGLFDVKCPSPRQDVIVTSSPVEICGSFTQPSAGWIVQATVEYAHSNLQGSEAQSSADIPVSGQDFHGNVPLTATYAAQDVTVQIRVYSGSGHTLGLWARRYTTES